MVTNSLVRPHLGLPRKIHFGQKIHSSLQLSSDKKYTPKARPLDDRPTFWEEARTKGLGDWLELDLYKYTETLVERFISESPGTALQNLRETAVSGTPAQLLTLFL